VIFVSLRSIFERVVATALWAVPDVRHGSRTGLARQLPGRDTPLLLMRRVTPHGPPAFAVLRHGRQARGYN
jgi:hypothetical protein